MKSFKYWKMWYEVGDDRKSHLTHFCIPGPSTKKILRKKAHKMKITISPPIFKSINNLGKTQFPYHVG